MLKVRSIHFCQNVIFSQVASYRLDACNFLRKGLAKISRRKFSKILKRAILQNTCGKTSVVECVLDKISEKDSRPVNMQKTTNNDSIFSRPCFHQEGFPVNSLEFLALLQRGLSYPT